MHDRIPVSIDGDLVAVCAAEAPIAIATGEAVGEEFLGILGHRSGLRFRFRDQRGELGLHVPQVREMRTQNRAAVTLGGFGVLKQADEICSL
jgi:hypothetical protein